MYKAGRLKNDNFGGQCDKSIVRAGVSTVGSESRNACAKSTGSKKDVIS